MRVLVTGSGGHLGEALVRTLNGLGHEVVGLDILDSPFTTHIGSISDHSCVKRCMGGMQIVFHAATLHKPHGATHRRQDFIDTNVTGTLNLLEEAVSRRRDLRLHEHNKRLRRCPRAACRSPCGMVTGEVTPVPKNIYGVTKAAAEDLCQLFRRKQGLACIVLRTSRFFPEEDDSKVVRETYTDGNLKANEYLYRRVEIEDLVSAHLLAAKHAPAVGLANV